MEFITNVVNPIVSNIVDPIVLLMFSVAVIVFIYGIVEMFINGTDPAARLKGRDHMLWGVVGIFIMVSAWGIIYFVSHTVAGLR